MQTRYEAPDVVHSSAWISFSNEVQRIKREKDMLILAHNYQRPEILEIADITGDSLELARRAQQARESTIVVCGVRFMAETAKLLNPTKKVLIPRYDAGCPLADHLVPEQIREAKNKHPGAPFVLYVNSSASCKAESDITCTSSNAVNIVRSLPEQEILFGPDRNLAAFVQQQVPEKIIIPVPDDGVCPIHDRMKPEDIKAAQQIGGFILCHPECLPEVTGLCDAVVSTGKMKDVIADHETCHIFTVSSMLYSLQKAWPEKVLYGLDTAVCKNMEKTTPDALLACITHEMYDVSVDEKYAQRARAALERMLAI